MSDGGSRRQRAGSSEHGGRPWFGESIGDANQPIDTHAPAFPRNGHAYITTQIQDNARVVQGDVIHNTNYFQTFEEPSDREVRKEKAQLKATFNKLRDSLRFHCMGARLLGIERALVETAQWFLELPEIVQWQDEDDFHVHNGFLWIKGKPGCGKSTIMKLLYEYFHGQTGRPKFVISYFFNARAPTVLEKSSLGLYRSLTHQIISQIEAGADNELAQLIQGIFMQCFKNKEQDGKVEDWTERELQHFLLSTLSEPRITAKWTLIIDALDEGHEDDVRRLVKFLERLSLHISTKDRRARICLASRQYPHISVRKSVEVVLEDCKQHDVDIQRYVDHALASEFHSL